MAKNKPAVTDFELLARESELEFTAEPTTLEEYAEEYLHLERQMAPMKKRMADMKAKVLENTFADSTTHLDNGIEVLRTTYASEHFMMKEFKEEHPAMHQRYLEDISKERMTIKYKK